MNDQFYIVLPSNSSMQYYSNNTTTKYVTQLPQPVHLNGVWQVALTEIQIPMSFQHISPQKDEIVILEYHNHESNDVLLTDIVFDVKSYSSHLPCGVYRDIESLVTEINNLECIKDHLQFEIDVGGYMHIYRKCESQCCDIHRPQFSPKVLKILGLNGKEPFKFTAGSQATGHRSVNLASGWPSIMMMYTDILQLIITGDVHSRLLRFVPFNAGQKFSYGTSQVRGFSPPMYLQILCNTFGTIEIDIRDEHGDSISFDSGTLTVVLHFKQFN